MNSKKIRINCGPTGGDACSPYYITFPEGMTAREFIMEQLSDEREWGHFTIKPEEDEGWDWLECEYRYGKVIHEHPSPLPEVILDRPLKKASGSGGWSRSDFVLVV